MSGEGIRAWKLTQSLQKKDDTTLNNIMYDLKQKYNINDEDFMTMNAIISIATMRRLG